MYHRIAEPACDPWQLGVSPVRFEQQLQQLCRNWKPISLTDLVENVKNRAIRNRSVALTFDDGYVDNFTYAKPLLEQYQVPATFFITTKNCERQLPFWWDELQSLILDSSRLPQQLTLEVADELFTFDLGSETALTPLSHHKHKTWTVADGMSTARCQLYYELWRRIKLCLDGEQQRVVALLKQWANVPADSVETPGCMTTQNIAEMASNSLFSLGAHTITHPALASHGVQVQHQEISGSRLSLEKMLKQPVNCFAYPYGNYNADSVSLLETEHFLGAVTTQQEVITKSSHLLKLGRYQVTNWDGSTFTSKLQEWYNHPSIS